MAGGGFAAQRLFFRLGHSPSPKHPTSTVTILSLSLSLSLFLSLLILLFCSIHFTLVSSHPIDARFIGVHDHHSQVLKPLRPG